MSGDKIVRRTFQILLQLYVFFRSSEQSCSGIGSLDCVQFSLRDAADETLFRLLILQELTVDIPDLSHGLLLATSGTNRVEARISLEKRGMQDLLLA